MLVNADLHIHSRHSMATADGMTFDNLARGALQKGVHCMGTGDCLHPEWRRAMAGLERIDEGTFEHRGMRFIPTAEVEDMLRVHHLLIFPSLSSVEEAVAILERRGENLTSDGRPRLRMTGEQIAGLAREVDALVGPCHAFTPWTSLYATHDTLAGCYGDMTHTVTFVELGLSAESAYADRIDELRRLTFLTNSDAHGPSPHRVAREFTRFELGDITAAEIRKGILREGGRRPVLNVGLPPQEGKYNETACVNRDCNVHVPWRDAERNRRRCAVCGRMVKIGVRDRVEQLATRDDPSPPPHRPPYLPLVPLAEIIARALGRGVNTRGVQSVWESLVTDLGNEIRVLVDTPLPELEGKAEEVVVRSIAAFRNGTVRFIPGGGGTYGQIRLPWEDVGDISRAPVQKGLADFLQG